MNPYRPIKTQRVIILPGDGFVVSWNANTTLFG